MYSLTTTRDAHESPGTVKYVPCLHLFTPLGQKVVLYSRPCDWNEFRPQTTLRETSLTTPISLAQHLYMITYGDSSIVSSWFWSKKAKEKLLLERMFSSIRKGMNKLHHAVMRCLVLDRVCWALRPLDNGDSRLWHKNYSTALVAGSGLPSSLKVAMEFCADSQTTIVTFLREWANHENVLKGEYQAQSSQDGSGRNIAASLGKRMTFKSNTSRMDLIEANFCAAALGLLGLALVRTNIFFDIIIRNVYRNDLEVAMCGRRLFVREKWAFW